MKSSNKITFHQNLFLQFLIIFWPPIFIFSLHVFLVRVLDLYTFFPWLDVPTHYLGGLSVAYSFSLTLFTLQIQKMISKLDLFIELVLVLTLASTVAVFWEFAEFLLDRFLGTNLQISLPDTMKDLLMGILGGATIIGYKIVASTIWRGKKERSPY